METPNTPITVTMTQPKLAFPWTDEKWEAHHNDPAVVAVRGFEDSNSQYRKAPSQWYTTLDMTQAHIGLTRDFIVDQQSTQNDDQTEYTYTYTLNRMWAVFAPRITDGVLFCVAGNGKRFFDTEAEAIKHMKKTTKAAAKWHAAEALRNQYAEAARAVCAQDGNTATPAGLIDDCECVGESVKIHQMGKFRTGIIVDQTPTKYIVVYTTPSNPTEIRTTTIGKDGRK